MFADNDFLYLLPTAGTLFRVSLWTLGPVDTMDLSGAMPLGSGHRNTSKKPLKCYKML